MGILALTEFVKKNVNYNIAYICDAIDKSQLDNNDKQFLKTSVKGVLRNSERQLLQHIGRESCTTQD